jgi:hypothetical protein
MGCGKSKDTKKDNHPPETKGNKKPSSASNN